MMHPHYYNILLNKMMFKPEESRECYENSFEVDLILQESVEKGERMFYVKWVGYPITQSTWQPITNLVNAKQKIKEWEKSQQKPEIKRHKHQDKDYKVRLSLSLSDEDSKKISKNKAIRKYQMRDREAIKKKEVNRKKQLQLFGQRIKARPKVYEKYCPLNKPLSFQNQRMINELHEQEQVKMKQMQQMNATYQNMIKNCEIQQQQKNGHGNKNYYNSNNSSHFNNKDHDNQQILKGPMKRLIKIGNENFSKQCHQIPSKMHPISIDLLSESQQSEEGIYEEVQSEEYLNNQPNINRKRQHLIFEEEGNEQGFAVNESLVVNFDSLSNLNSRLEAVHLHVNQGDQGQANSRQEEDVFISEESSQQTQSRWGQNIDVNQQEVIVDDIDYEILMEYNKFLEIKRQHCDHNNQRREVIDPEDEEEVQMQHQLHVTIDEGYSQLKEQVQQRQIEEQIQNEQIEEQTQNRQIEEQTQNRQIREQEQDRQMEEQAPPEEESQSQEQVTMPETKSEEYQSLQRKLEKSHQVQEYMSQYKFYQESNQNCQQKVQKSQGFVAEFSAVFCKQPSQEHRIQEEICNQNEDLKSRDINQNLVKMQTQISKQGDKLPYQQILIEQEQIQQDQGITGYQWMAKHQQMQITEHKWMSGQKQFKSNQICMQQEQKEQMLKQEIKSNANIKIEKEDCFQDYHYEQEQNNIKQHKLKVEEMLWEVKQQKINTEKQEKMFDKEIKQQMFDKEIKQQIEEEEKKVALKNSAKSKVDGRKGKNKGNQISRSEVKQILSGYVSYNQAKQVKCFEVLLKDGSKVNVQYEQLKKMCPTALIDYYEKRVIEF